MAMYSSSTLEGPSKSGCWKMLDFAEANTPSLFPLEYRSYLGQAAHAVLQYCAEQGVHTEGDIRVLADEVGNLLIREGREFRGRTEPPLPPDDVWAGVDVAVSYLLARGLPLESDIVIPEKDWIHPRIPYRALIDLVTAGDEGDEEYERRVCEVGDYKSSWQAGGDELDSLQRWGQVVCVWRALTNGDELGNVEIIRQRVVNLRTWAEYTRDIHLDDPDEVAELEKWEKRIGELCKTADEARIVIPASELPAGDNEDEGPFRPANPGVGCLSCAWRHVCEEGTTFLNIDGLSTERLAMELAKTEGFRSMLIKAIKASDPEGPIAIQGGWVGFKEQPRRIFREGSERGILDEWLSRTACEIPEADIPVLVSLLSALNLGKGNLDSLAKKLMPERAKGIKQVRDDYVESLTVEKRAAQFGVWKDE